MEPEIAFFTAGLKFYGKALLANSEFKKLLESEVQSFGATQRPASPVATILDPTKFARSVSPGDRRRARSRVSLTLPVLNVPQIALESAEHAVNVIHLDLEEESHDLRFGESLLHHPTLSLGRTLKPKRYSNRGGVVAEDCSPPQVGQWPAPVARVCSIGPASRCSSASDGTVRYYTASSDGTARSVCAARQSAVFAA